MAKKRKPKGKAPVMNEAKSDEAATPDQKDLERADELASTDPILDALWNAQPMKEEEDK